MSKNNFNKFGKDLKKAIRKTYKDKIDEIADKKAAPIVKRVLREQVKEDVVDKDFVDKKGRYRKYRVVVNGKNFPSRELGHGRTQTGSYKKMADEQYNVSSPSVNGHFNVYNNFPPSTSIYGTPIDRLNIDPLLYTKWIVDGKIVMPTLTTMTYAEWINYTKKIENRYEARPFVKKAYKRIQTKKITREIGAAVGEELVKEVIKKLK